MLRDKTRFKNQKHDLKYDDTPDLLPETVDRGSLYVPPVKPVVVPMADKELPYGVPNAKSLRRQIKQAILRRENDQRRAAGLPPVLPPVKKAKTKPSPRPKAAPVAPERKPRANRAPVASPVDRASILADLRSRKTAMMNRPPSKPETVSTLLARAEVLARQAGDDELASKILNLRLFGDGDANADIPVDPEFSSLVQAAYERRFPAAEPADDVPPFDPPYTREESGYRIPSGKYRGCLMRDLTTQQLQRVWSGFNGRGQYDVADLLKAELRARMVVNR